MTYDEAEKFPKEHTLRYALVEGSKNLDLDEAVLGVQAVLGIESGDMASLFFSGLPEDEWPEMTDYGRFSRLYAYAEYELQVDLVGAFHRDLKEQKVVG
ncbi:MAG: hypothetical protein NXH70_02295 [Hyphomonas sp.]|nr:hypothetical protein [Hyphomonas sp.]